MQPGTPKWELTILDADPLTPMANLQSQVIGDVDGDGNLELIVGGQGGLLWYRPATFERGLIAAGIDVARGLALEDVDGDGHLEVVVSAGSFAKNTWSISWYKPLSDLSQAWQRFEIDPACSGQADEIFFIDLDGDGRREMIANSVSSPDCGVFIYRPGDDVKNSWLRSAVVQKIQAKGLAAADLDGDGRVEIINGPDWFKAPLAGPYSGVWQRHTYAGDIREMCRVVLADVSGNGLPDILLVESEYVDARLVWYENRFSDHPDKPFLEHRIETGFHFTHSLTAWNEDQTGQTSFLLAEMAQAGGRQPYNYNARLIRIWTSDRGKTWEKAEIDHGAGTHQVQAIDIDGDGELEIVGHESLHPRIMIWDQNKAASFPIQYQHRFIDRDKPYTSTDLVLADVNGNGIPDVVSGAWWYRNPTWERYEIPDIYQVLSAYDLDGDGRMEFIAILHSQVISDNWYEGLSAQLVWIKPVDAEKGVWERHTIGTGRGDWPHGTLVVPLLPGGKLALLTAYHSCWSKPDDFPQLFEIPTNPAVEPWPVRTLAEIQYSENYLLADIDGDGVMDIVAGMWWLQNKGDGTFIPHRITEENIDIAQCAVADINGNGWPDILLSDATAEVIEGKPMPRLLWFENPGWGAEVPWKRHVIDLLRWPHSLAVEDVDGDGQLEIICGEHDPAHPFRNQCRLFLYKPANRAGTAWKRFTLDERFEHHCGVRLLDTGHGKAIVSHGWGEGRYLHIWEPQITQET
jgi:hypothetical protein